MGGISFIIYDTKEFSINNEFIKSFRKMVHRGSESNFNIETTIPINQNNLDQIKYTLTRNDIANYKQLGFIQGCHRMCINDLSCDASQPFEDPIIHKVKKYPELRTRVHRKLFCNGEIYNYKELLEQEKFTERDLQSCSDVEIILPLYIKYGLEETIKKLKGDYAFILTENLKTYDLKSINIYAVRDILGLKPLYMIKHKKYIFYMFVSELKGIPNYILNDSNYELCEIPPGTYWSFQNSIIEKNSDEFIRYSDWNYYKSLTNCTINNALPETISNLYKNINEKLTLSVMSKYNLSDRQVGILLSGGFDSSIILSILIKYLSEFDMESKKYIYVFSIGELNENEIIHSEKCVKFLEEKYNIDIHHHIISLQEISQFTKEIENAIMITESFDIRTIRLSLPYLFLFKYISEKTKVKVLLTGEGLDELCGYKEFDKLSDELYQSKSVKLLKNLSKHDLSRCDKLASYYKLELRHPFLDSDFLELILSIHPKIKRPQIYNILKKPIEKYIIRKAFDIKDQNENSYLPYDVLWRGKEDITNSFIKFNDKIDEFFTNSKVTEKDYYMEIFNKYYPNSQNIIGKYWEQLWESI
jgi:asparagine synthase (glutamine-hydrolysing)